MIEHEPLEIDDGTDAEGESPSRFAGPSPLVRDVLVAVLVQALPCPVCGRLVPCRCHPPEGYSKAEARAALIEAALIEYGHLPDSQPSPAFDPEEAARWLAERSGFPRYTGVTDGWHRLLEAEADVELAAYKASQRVTGEDAGRVKAMKAALLAWHQSRSV